MTTVTTESRHDEDILQRIVAVCIGADALCVEERLGDDGVVLVASPMDTSDWTVWDNITIVTTAEAVMASGLPASPRERSRSLR